jgi:putative membrane protein
VRSAARAAFVDLGISRTSGRWGVLVYVSILERAAEVVPDLGVDLGMMGEEWTRAVKAIHVAAARLDFEAFKAAALALGPVLGKAHPHRDDDVNELPDEVSAS